MIYLARYTFELIVFNGYLPEVPLPSSTFSFQIMRAPKY
jgi:hypothetical protein